MGLTSPLELALPRGRTDAHDFAFARLRVAVLRRRRGLAAAVLALAVVAVACAFGASFMARDARLGPAGPLRDAVYRR